jgi:hypothetical protein
VNACAGERKAPGHAYCQHFKANGYDFPGEPKGLNATFAVPHDTAHVVSGMARRRAARSSSGPSAVACNRTTRWPGISCRLSSTGNSRSRVKPATRRTQRAAT